MIPLSDETRRLVRIPFVTLAIIAVNAVMFVMELQGGDSFIDYWSLVPANILTSHGIVTVFTSMFMHAGWEHILGNMVFFWAFAPEIEDAMGSLPFLVFYFLGGVVATIAQVVIDPASTVPNLGASGAIAAVMGAFLITYPRDQIRTVILIGWFARITFLPAALMVGLWFLTQLFSEVGALAQVDTGGGVAYMAHIGGFVFGMLVCRLFEFNRRRYQQENEYI